MSMFDDVVLGLGRTGYVNESVEPELQDEEFDSIEGLDESVDPMEYIANAIYVNEMNMSNLDKAIMCEEYMYLREHGTEMVYEAVNIKSIIDRAKTAVMNLWNRLKSFLKTQADKLVTKMDEAFLKKYEENALKGKQGKINGFKDLFMLGAQGIVDAAEASFKNLNDIADEVYAKASSDDTEDKDYPKFDDFMKKYEKDGEAALVKSELKTAKEASKKETIIVTSTIAIKAYKGILASKNAVKNLYNKSKDNINKQLKSLKALEKTYKSHKVFSTETSKHIHQSVRIINKIGSWLATVNRVELRFLNMLKAQSKAVIINAASKGSAVEILSGDKKDDASVEESSFISGLQIL